MIDKVIKGYLSRQAYYNLTVLSFNCEEIPDVKPSWYQKSQWPYFQYAKI